MREATSLTDLAFIYDVMRDEEALRSLPATLADGIGARSVAIQAFDRTGQLLWVVQNYFNEQFRRRYVDLKLFEDDPWVETSRVCGILDKSINLDPLVPVDRLERSRFASEGFRAIGDDTGHCVGAMLPTAFGFVTVGAHRPIGHPFAPGTTSLLDPILPHLIRSLEVRATLDAAVRRSEVCEALLDKVAPATMVLGADGCPIHLNRCARAILDATDGLVLRATGIDVADSTARIHWRQAVAEACSGPCKGATLLAPRPSGLASYTIRVLPWRIGRRRCALVVIHDPCRTPPDTAALLTSLYGFTAAEAATAALLWRGDTPSEIADSRGVSLSTIRTQIARAMEKAGVRRISELMLLAERIPRLWDAPEA